MATKCKSWEIPGDPSAPTPREQVKDVPRVGPVAKSLVRMMGLKSRLLLPNYPDLYYIEFTSVLCG